MRNVWCLRLSLAELVNGKPQRYTVAMEGDEKAPGRIGGGFGGEPVVCLLPDDSGQWFANLAAKHGGATFHTGCRHLPNKS